MSRLAEIYKQEKQSGAGIGSAVGKRLGERLDPRQIFDRSGVIATMFPALKSYSATKAVKGAATTPNAATPALSLDASAFSDISAASKISAKNSMVLPAMARDMNLMRQNIAKIVKLQGGTAATKGDMFFRRAAERESMFGSAFSKMTRKSGSVGFTAGGSKTRDGQTKETALYVETSGMLDDLLGGLVGGAAAGGIKGKLSGALAKALPFLASATLPVLGIAGLAGLLYFLIKNDSGEAQTVDEMQEGGGYTPEQQGRAAPAAEPFTVDEQIRARENMRVSEDPNVRAAAAELDKTSPLPITTKPTSTITPEPVSGMDHPSAGAAMTPTPSYTTQTPTTPSQDFSIGGAITNAAAVTGVPAQTLAIFGQLESGLGKIVDNKLSTAKGPFQFIESTWLSMMQKHGKKYGYDPSTMTRQEQLDLRYNNRASALMAAEYTKENAAKLQINPADPANVDELYLAHFLGPEGAKRVLSGQGLSEKQKANVLKYNPNIKTGSNEEFLQFASGKTAQAAKVSAVQQIAGTPSSGAVVASVSTTVADGQRTTGGSSNVVVDNSQRTTVASSASAGKPASAYDKDMIDALVGTSYA